MHRHTSCEPRRTLNGAIGRRSTPRHALATLALLIAATWPCAAANLFASMTDDELRSASADLQLNFDVLKAGERPLPGGWKLLERVKDATGFDAAVYEHRNAVGGLERRIVFGGTQQWQDWVVDVQQARGFGNPLLFSLNLVLPVASIAARALTDATLRRADARVRK